MKTFLWPVQNQELPPEAGRFLREGKLVAFPTETVYGLGANALDGQAVARIFQAKGRPQDNPLITHIYDLAQMEEYGQNISALAWKLARNFWPGPLTLIVENRHIISPVVTAGLDSLGLRMPNHPVALALLRASGVPVAAPSANLSGHPSPTTAQHVWDDLQGKIEAVVDGGACAIGLESTVLDVRGEVPIILRPGAITPEQIRNLTGQVALDATIFQTEPMKQKPLSPGMKYRHYAPKAPLILWEGSLDKIPAAIACKAREAGQKGQKVGIWGLAQNQRFYPPEAVFLSSGSDSPAQRSAALYAALREMDRLEVDLILVEGLEPQGLGLAAENRLRKAAAQIIRLD